MVETIGVCHSAQGAANAIMALGVAAGVFAEEGLDVIMEEVPRTGDAVKRLLAGTTEFVVVGAVPILSAAYEGHHPVIVMSIEAENVFGIIGARSIGSSEDLRDKTIAISGRGEQDDIMIRRALSEWRIDPNRGVTFMEYASRGGCWQAIVSGEAAAMCATIPQPILARAIGLPVLKDFAQLHEPLQAGCVTTTRAYIDARPDIVRRFLTGQLRAVRLFQKDFEAALPHLIARSKLDDVAVLRETHRLFAHAAENYVPNPAASSTVLRNLSEARGEPIDVDLEKIIDPTFAMALEGRAPYVCMAN
ncbi:MAG: ABC transporter substrate-binding protein [Nitrospinaceae bacterium]|jgi:ABC-type nitrate/sulfonate/bicarbonate transport system substrate-binding protein|nr:ABC transporter substrate-binding protein [Nitrospinaceae bacterium]MBT3432276.1 ABC transporter substrate-binding protein [Nitrospinaceae bacterium]MBT3822205.1 ABC transporter substrate-binding protein [Nitrospinaceae bacterium]MBT4092357.1 ABC transporter substrate-binding protein [Nitrospinaceae bacterium]MBT4428966.1 ABC transporter substrate-binding protein [Nitrospinaceae bacterium]